jgi:molybdopterin converting factor small subunit
MTAMKVDVKCFANLADKDTCSFDDATVYEIENGRSVRDLIDQVRLPADKVALTFVNGRQVTVDTALADGDRVGFFPATGGM